MKHIEPKIRKSLEWTTSDIIDSRRAISDKMKEIAKRAMDEGRERTKAEDELIEAYSEAYEMVEEIEQKSAFLDGLESDAMKGGIMMPGSATNPNKRSNARNILGEIAVAHYKKELQQESGYEARDITTSSAGGILQNPVIQQEFFANLAHENPLNRLGVSFDTHPYNYGQSGYASGEPVVLAHATETAAVTADSTMSILGRKFSYFTRYVAFDVSYEIREDAPFTTEIISEEGNVAINNDILAQFMQGDGTSTPLGLDNLTGLSTTDLGGSAFDFSDVIDWVSTPMANRARPDQIGILHGTSTWKILGKLQATDNQYIKIPDALSQVRWEWTSAVKETYSTDKTKVYLGDFNHSRVAFMKQPLRVIYSTSKLGTNLTHRYIFVTRYDITHHRPSLYHRIDNVPTS